MLFFLLKCYLLLLLLLLFGSYPKEDPIIVHFDWLVKDYLMKFLKDKVYGKMLL